MQSNYLAETKGTPFLDRLSQPVRDCLLSKAQTKTFERGATICMQDEPATSMKVVLKGWVKMYRVSSNGNEAVLSTLRDGDSFDEIVALQGGTSSASAEAASNCSVMYLDLTSICSCEGASKDISNAILSTASDHMEAMIGHIERLKVQNGTQRLSEYLLDLSETSEGSKELVLPYGKVLLAGKLGMKPESLSRAFGRLKDIGVRSSQRNVSINCLTSLKTLVEDQQAYT